MAESIISQTPDVLVAPIDFSVGNAASYIVGRENATYFSSQNLVAPDNVRVCKFQIGSNGFLDLSSLYVTGLLHNKGAAAITPLTCEAHCLFKRLIVRISGTLVESQEFHNVSEEFIRRLLPLEKRMNLSSMFLGSVAGTGVEGHDLLSNSLGAGNSKRIMYRPMGSGVLNLSKYLPALVLGQQALSIELECCPADEAFTSTQTVSYELSDLRCLCDTVTLTTELTDQYTSLLLTGKSIFIPIDLNTTTQHFLPGASAKFSVHSAVQFSRLNTLIAIMQQAPGTARETKQVNNFFLPSSASETVESNLVVAGHRSPLFNNRGISEHIVRFLRGTGGYAGVGTSTSISYDSFGGGSNPGRSFAIVFDCEKLPMHGVDHTGIPVDGGGVITLNVENVGTQDSEYVDRVLLSHHHSGTIELRDSGVTLYS